MNHQHFILNPPKNKRCARCKEEFVTTARARKNCLSCKPAGRHPSHAYLDKL